MPQHEAVLTTQRLLKVIGKGGWGVVYKGMDEWTAGIVAVKQVKTTGIPPDELKGMMVRPSILCVLPDQNEITLLQQLKNENIVRYIDSHITENAFYIVLEYVPFIQSGDQTGFWRMGLCQTL